MINLITYNDFTFPFMPDISKQTAIEKLNYTISIYQKEFLIKILGYKEYQNFSDAIDIEPLADKWNNFLNGVTYTDSNNNKIIYEGIKEALKLYIFVKHIYFISTVTTSNGEQSPLFDNGQPDNFNSKIINANNLMVEKIQNIDNSIYKFLDDFSTDFPDVEMSKFYKKNYFGI